MVELPSFSDCAPSCCDQARCGAKSWKLQSWPNESSSEFRIPKHVHTTLKGTTSYVNVQARHLTAWQHTMITPGSVFGIWSYGEVSRHKDSAHIYGRDLHGNINGVNTAPVLPVAHGRHQGLATRMDGLMHFTWYKPPRGSWMPSSGPCPCALHAFLVQVVTDLKTWQAVNHVGWLVA